MGKVSDLNQIHPLDCPHVEQVRKAWANQHWYYDKGYIRYWIGQRAAQREHHLVAKNAFGVTISRNVIVRHLDGDLLNNRASNLEVISRSSLFRYDANVNGERIALVCPVCDTVFEATLFRVLHRQTTYCSDKCRSLADRKVERPSAQYLFELMTEVSNWTTIGRMYGVSDNAVRKWARRYGLDLSVCDGRLKR
jgi:hypothetical protein